MGLGPCKQAARRSNEFLVPGETSSAKDDNPREDPNEYSVEHTAHLMDVLQNHAHVPLDNSTQEVADSTPRRSEPIQQHVSHSSTGDNSGTVSRAAQHASQTVVPNHWLTFSETNTCPSLLEQQKVQAHAQKSCALLMERMGSAGKFTDTTFPAGPESLYNNGAARSAIALEGLNHRYQSIVQGMNIQWRRPSGILQRPDDLGFTIGNKREMVATLRKIRDDIPWRVFHQAPRAEDVSQGGLGNCWLCGCLAACLHCNNDAISRLFLYSSPLHGAYVLKLCVSGAWNYVIQDDRFPVVGAGFLAFSGARRQQLFVPLLEKAHAKLMGTYEKSEGGTSSEGLRLLTGWPSQTVTWLDGHNKAQVLGRLLGHVAVPPESSSTVVCHSEQELWSFLVRKSEDGYIMVGCCGYTLATSEEYITIGLSRLHCYSIEQIRKVGDFRLLKLRNPAMTPNLEFKGQFRRKAKVWNQTFEWGTLVDTIGPPPENDRIVWLDLSEFMKFFVAVTVSLYKADWFEDCRDTVLAPTRPPEEDQEVYFLEVEKQASVKLAVMQRAWKPGFTLLDIGMLLVLYDAEARTVKVEKVERSSVSENIIMLSSLSPGVYFVVTFTFGHRKWDAISATSATAQKYTFACFSNKGVKVTKGLINQEFYRLCFCQYVKEYGDKEVLDGGFRVVKAMSHGTMVIYCENPSLDSDREFRTEITAHDGMVLSRNAADVTDVIPAGHCMVTMIAAAQTPAHTCSFNARLVGAHPAKTTTNAAATSELWSLHRPFPLSDHLKLNADQRIFDVETPSSPLQQAALALMFQDLQMLRLQLQKAENDPAAPHSIEQDRLQALLRQITALARDDEERQQIENFCGVTSSA